MTGRGQYRHPERSSALHLLLVVCARRGTQPKDLSSVIRLARCCPFGITGDVSAYAECPGFAYRDLRRSFPRASTALPGKRLALQITPLCGIKFLRLLLL